MANENTATAQDQTDKSDAGRERSTIAFPYGDLDDGVAIAKAAHATGGQKAGVDQVAAHLKHDSVTSGAFRLKVNTSRTFGLIETQGNDVLLTPLGQAIADPKQEPRARVDAFLAVPLYRKIYDTFRGGTLPGEPGLENSMIEMGVASKQRERARQAFQRSASQAGMFESGRDRLVIPARACRPADAPLPKDEAPAPPKDPLSPLPPQRHPFIDGLILTLPPTGATWGNKGRKKWLATAEHIFSMIYEDGPEDGSD